MGDDLQLNHPQTLYRRWEQSQWSPFEIDLTIDRQQWPRLDEAQRGLMLFALSSLMVAEERITTKFSALVEAHERLVAAPGDRDAKVRFVTLYHLVIEATLGLTSFKFITDYLDANGLLPGFVDGYSRIHHDETRHIGLRHLVAARGRARRARRRGGRAPHAARRAAVGCGVAQAAG